MSVAKCEGVCMSVNESEGMKMNQNIDFKLLTGISRG
jgi:hypothetical protein